MGQFTCDGLIAYVAQICKDPPHDRKFIYRLYSKGYSVQTAGKGKSLSSVVILPPLGTQRINLVRLCVFAAL